MGVEEKDRRSGKKVKKREKSEETGNDGTRNVEYVKKSQEKTEKL